MNDSEKYAKNGSIHRDWGHSWRLGSVGNTPHSHVTNIMSPKSCVQMNETEKCSETADIDRDHGQSSLLPVSFSHMLLAQIPLWSYVQMNVTVKYSETWGCSQRLGNLEMKGHW